MKRVSVILFLLVAQGCGTTYTGSRPAQYYAEAPAVGSAGESLFAGDAAVLSDDDIGKILAIQYRPPRQSRIALLPFGWGAFDEWSEELALVTDDIDAGVVQRLRASERVYDASYLPSILIPEQRTVPYLREAGARYQADLLLVFRSACGSFLKTRFLSPGEAKSYCNVEAVLLDVRTGLVPFSAVSSQTFETIRTKDDYSLDDALLRSQLGAIADALGEIASAVSAFLAAS